MKICLINNLYPPYTRGGTERVVAKLVQTLSKNHKVVLVTLTDRFQLSPQLKEQGNFKIYRFFPLNFFSFVHINAQPVWLRFFWHIFDIFNLHSYFIVRKILKKEHPEVVYTHNLKGLGYLIPRAIRKNKIKHIHTLHDIQLSAPSGLIIYGAENNFAQRIFLRKWYEAVCRALFASPDIIIAPSKWLLDFYRQRGFFKNSRKIVWPNPLTVKATAPYSVKEINFLYLGQIEAHKGILFLIEVFKKIEAKLHVLGTGSELDKIKEMARGRQNIVIHGFIAPEQLNKFFIQATATIIPSFCYENCPQVVLESFAYGLPVIASRLGGLPELIQEGKNGFTFEPQNESALIKNIQRIRTAGIDLNKMSQNCLESVQNLSAQKYSARFLDLVR